MAITKDHIDLLSAAENAHATAEQQEQAAVAAKLAAAQQKQNILTTIGAEMAPDEIRVFAPAPVRALLKDGDTVKIIDIPNVPTV